MKEFLEFIKGLVSTKKDKIYVLAFVSALVVSIAIAFGLGFRVDGAESAKNLQDIGKPLAVIYWIISFVFSFISFLALLTIIKTKEAEDVYSFARDSLKGKWMVYYDIQNGYTGPVVARPAVSCDIDVNQLNKKLELKFKITDNPIYEDSDQIIQSVAVRDSAPGQYYMMYYFEGSRGVKIDLAKHIISDKIVPDPRNVTVEIYGIVYFSMIPGSKEIREMKGEWYDLNGNITLLFALYDRVLKLSGEEKENFQVKLSDVHIGSENFNAKMGGILFQR